MWKREFIPDDDDLYRRIHPRDYNRKTGRISPGAFILRKRKGERALSTNWSKYTTPQKTSLDPNTGRRFYVGALCVEVPRHQELEVIHTPTRKNRGHSSITGQRLIDSNFLIADILAENCRPVITSI